MGGRSDRPDERGSIALPAVIGIALLLLCFVLVAQLATWQYGRGAVRAAAQEAARAEAPLDAEDGVCQARFELVRSQVLGGSLGSGVGPPRCTVGSGRVTVQVDATFESWLPLISDWSTTITAIAIEEVEPQ